MNPPQRASPPPFVRADIRYVQIPDGRVRVRVLGRGEPALFVHGVSAHGRSWLPVAEALARGSAGLQCWLPDLLGRGESDANPELSYGLGHEADRLRAIVASLRRETRSEAPRLVIGHSHGAAIGLAYARHEPGIQGLVLSNPVSAEIRRPWALAALRSRGVRTAVAAVFAPLHRPLGRMILRRAGGPHFSISAAMRNAYADPYGDPRRARTLMRILADWRPSELAHRLPDRAFVGQVLSGAHDPRIPASTAQRLARRLGLSFSLVEDGGHVLPEQHPERFASTITRIAEEVRSANQPT